MAQHAGYYNHYMLFKYSSVIIHNSNASRKLENLKFLMGMDHTSVVTRATVTNNDLNKYTSN